MRQRMLFAKIAGLGPERITAKLLTFFQGASAKDIEEFLEKMRTSINPPLLYFCEYLDYWSTGEFLSKLEEKAIRFHWSLPTKGADVLLYYFYPFNPKEIIDLLNPLKKWPNPSDETVWFFKIFEQCLLSWEGLVKGDAAVVLVRLVVGGTLLDDEILNSKSCDLF